MFLYNLLPLIMLSLGGYLLVKLRFFFILHPIKTLKSAFSGKDRKEGAVTLMLALAGTLGVGNIIGVTSAIAVGGPGSLFWLVVSAVFSSAIKYSEITLSKISESPGMMGALRKFCPKAGARLAQYYALLCVALSLSMGCVLQASAIRGAAEAVSSSAVSYICLAIFILAASVCAFGKDGIKRAVAVTVPFAAAAYTAICLLVILSNLSDLPYAVRSVIASAFSPGPVLGGVIGAISKNAVSEGFAAGLLSNEAGAGTSSLAHSGSPDSYGGAGCLGIIEILVDTVIICPLTGFTVILGRIDPKRGVFALGELFSSYIPFGAEALLISVLAFALSTVICWYYYGSVCREYLFGRRGEFIYFFLFIISLAAGLFMNFTAAEKISNLILTILTLLTATAIIKGTDKISMPL